MTPDNIKTNKLVDAGRLPKNQRENVPQEQTTLTSVGQETPTQTVERARKMLEPTVSATQLAEPVTPVTVPEPVQPSVPTGTLNVARNVSRNAQGFIEAQTAEQARLRELQETFGGLRDQGSLSDVFQEQREAFGATPETLSELKDIQLRLADMDTESGLTETRIEGAAGQTINQSQREVTQEQRENAVRTAGLAARAAVLQGSIETATQLAKDAVNIEYQQRTLDATNLLNQINMVQGQVDDQTAQLLEQEKRGYEAELATIQEVKDNVANAMVNGATQAEIAQLTSDQMSDADKIALAQSITARGAGELRDLGIQQTQASIRSSNASAARNEVGALLDLAEAGDPGAIAQLGLTMPDNTQPTSDEIAFARQYADTGKIPSGLGDISFGRIAELAADLPKADGTLVSKNTGVAPDGLSATEQTAYENLYNAINTDLPVLLQSWDEMNSFTNLGGTGVVGGIASTVNPSEANVRFETAKADFLAKLLVARSGAAVTEQEYERYAKLIPGAFNTPFGVGTSGDDKLKNLDAQMNSALQDKLSVKGLSIYGYSQVDLDGEKYAVGEIVTNEYGEQGRVNPDGTITVINQ